MAKPTQYLQAAGGRVFVLLGTAMGESGYGIAVDTSGNAYITGYTE